MEALEGKRTIIQVEDCGILVEMEIVKGTVPDTEE